ncbi:MAG: hypothetical protein JWM15_2076, partial [Cryptosporangiaceae bacterium]|nr:hypothetical protein [Cryptosporangiaceae bacterium]
MTATRGPGGGGYAVRTLVAEAPGGISATEAAAALEHAVGYRLVTTLAARSAGATGPASGSAPD